MEAVTLRIGRWFCPVCRITRACVRPVDVTELRCPTCEALCLEGCGDD